MSNSRSLKSLSHYSKPEHFCYYCNREGHIQPNCYAMLKDLNVQSAHPAQEHSADVSNLEETAGNANLRSFDPSDPLSPLQLDADYAWNADTGATSHMTPHRHWIRNYQPFRVPIKLADKSVVYSAGMGTVVFNPIINGKEVRPVEFSRVLHVPDLRSNLLSVLYLTRLKQFIVTISSHSMDFALHKETLFTASINDHNSAFLDGTTSALSEFANTTSTLPLDISLWHHRFAHHNIKDLKKLHSRKLVIGMELQSLAQPDPICEPCLSGKMHAHPFPSSENRSSSLLELIHSDVKGPLPKSASGFLYWVTFIDDYSRFRVIYPLKSKDGVFAAFQDFKAYAENHTGCKIKNLRDDKGGEYMSNAFTKFTTDAGIVRQHTVRNRPQENGVAERANRVLGERITSMLQESKLPNYFWGDCLATLVHIWNMSPTSTVKNATPYELWFKKKPNVSHLRVWGCTAYVHIQRDKRRSLGSHMEKCVFVGYPPGYKGWKFYNPTTKHTFISERADFDERFFGLKHTPVTSSPFTEAILDVPNTTEPSTQTLSNAPDAFSPIEQDVSDFGGEDPIPVIANLPPHPAPAPALAQAIELLIAPAAPIHPIRAIPPLADVPLANRREPRNVRPPGEWWANARQRLNPTVTPEPTPTPDPITPVHSRSPSPISSTSSTPATQTTPLNQSHWREPTPLLEDDDSYSEYAEFAYFTQDTASQSIQSALSRSHLEICHDDASFDQAEYAYFTEQAEPKTLKQAMSRSDRDKWHEACTEEMMAHMGNGTWEIVDAPVGSKVIGSGWVFKVKRNADGSIKPFKARLVAKGYSQCPRFDFTEIFAPTNRSSSIRLILAISAIQDLHLHSIDVSHAFTNGDLEETIYMKQPEGFHSGRPGQVCLLKKSLYGLKQAARMWNLKLHAALVSLGFNRLNSDRSIYIYVKGDVRIIMPIFVDDITLASSSQSAINSTIKDLAAHFKLRDLGPTSFLLGIQIIRDRSKHQISLCQRQYIIDMLETFNLSDCNPVTTPMEPGLTLTKSSSPSTQEEIEFMWSVPYLNAVGKLNYLATTTRCDISHTVSKLASFSSNPGPAHWKAVKHLLRYLKGTMDYKLVYSPDNSPHLFTTYTDADHGGDKDNGRSTGGYLVKFASAAVCWSSKLQPVVALSTTEAEFIAAVEAGKEILWMRNILSEFGYKINSPSILHIDNQSAICVAKNPQHHGRMKHLDLRFYWLRDAVEGKKIMPSYIPTAEMAADILTKALPGAKVNTCRLLMGLQD